MTFFDAEALLRELTGEPGPDPSPAPSGYDPDLDDGLPLPAADVELDPVEPDASEMTPENLSAYWRAWYLAKVTILERDDGRPREHAEAEALAEALAAMRRAGNCGKI